MSRSRSRRGELTAAMLDIVASRGLDEVSVREVASAAGVSIGTVQHYFPTKDAMLVAALEEVVRRTRERVSAVRLGPDVRRNLGLVLRELLPLDDVRLAEARTQLAFAARAATSPALGAIQRDLLAEIQTELAAAFRYAGQTAAAANRSARIGLAATDGLAQHAVSAAGLLTERQLTASLDALLDLLLR